MWRWLAADTGALITYGFYLNLAVRGLVSCVIRASDRLREVQERFPDVQVAEDVAEALLTAEFDAVVISTEATKHHEVSCQCLRAGKHVLVEKPLAVSSEQAEEMIELAERNDLTLMVGHTFIFNSAVQKIKEYVDRRDMGHLYYLYACRTNLGPIRRDVNAIWDLAPHDISIFNYLIGSVPSWVSAVGSRVLGNHHHDVGFITLGYEDGLVGNIHVSWADPNKVRELVVVSSSKRIVFDDLNDMERIRIFEKGVVPADPEAASYGEYHFLVRDGDIISPKIEVSEPLKNQCDHFLSCIETGETPETDGKVGLDVVRIMEAIDKSIEQNGMPVEIVTAPVFA